MCASICLSCPRSTRAVYIVTDACSGHRPKPRQGGGTRGGGARPHHARVYVSELQRDRARDDIGDLITSAGRPVQALHCEDFLLTKVMP